jgi:hypothetical protein
MAASARRTVGEASSRTDANNNEFGKGKALSLNTDGRAFLRPLDRLRVATSKPGRLIVRDGRQEIYVEIPIQ